MIEQGCYEENLSAYLDGELSGPEAAMVEAHLQNCPDCRAILKRMQEVSCHVQELPRPAVNPLLMAQIMGRLQGQATLGDLTLTGLLRFWGWLSILVLGVTALLVGPLVLGLFTVMVKHLAIVFSLLVKLSWQLPPGTVNVSFGLVLLSGAAVSFYGFGRVYKTMFQEESVL